MRILAQIWSLILGLVLVAIFYGVAVTMPKFKRVIPEDGYRDLQGIAQDETTGMDGTVTINRLQRGDLIAYEIRERAQSKVAFGYVVGLPGEVMKFAPGETNKDLGVLAANDRIPEENRGTQPHYMVGFEALPVPDNHVYVLSDRHLQDSFALGPIPAQIILGRVKDF